MLINFRAFRVAFGVCYLASNLALAQSEAAPQAQPSAEQTQESPNPLPATTPDVAGAGGAPVDVAASASPPVDAPGLPAVAAPGPATAPGVLPAASATGYSNPAPPPRPADSPYPAAWSQERPPPQAPRPQGAYFQLRAMGLFGLNSTHEFRHTCPTYECSVTTPLGLGVGFTTGWEKNGWAVEVLGLFLFDRTRASYHRKEQKTVLVPSGDAAANASGSASSSGDLDVKIGKDGIKITGDLFGDSGGQGDANGTLVSKTVIEDKREDNSFTRIGGAVGVGVRRNFGRRPGRVSLAITGGVLRRGISLTALDRNVPAYTAPFGLIDFGVVLGKRGTVQLSIVGLAEFPHSRWLEDPPAADRIKLLGGAQYFLGPMLGIQWGPRGTPVLEAEAEPVESRRERRLRRRAIRDAE